MRRAPVLAGMQLPELPPGYEVVHEKAADYGPEVTEDFWGITVRGDWCDGLDEPWPKTRAEAVERAWSMWLDYDADEAWREFVEDELRRRFADLPDDAPPTSQPPTMDTEQGGDDETATRTITITLIPDDASPLSLAREGEILSLEANGTDNNPSPQAWARAGIAASAIMRVADGMHGQIELALLVSLLAGNCEPAHDDSTPQRAALIQGHRSVAAEWANGHEVTQ